MNKLSQIFDRVDVVMRWRRNEADSGDGAAQFGNVFRHFVARKLTAFARLGALCHLDLNLIGAGQVFCADAKTSRGNLFDF